MQSPVAHKIDYSRYLHLLWRRKWFVLVPGVLCTLAAAYMAMNRQDQFMSSTLILVQPQKVPTQFVPTTITTSIEERLQTISQQIFSRTRLEQIIQEFNLFAEERQERTAEEIVTMMRTRIELTVHRNDAFQLAFIDPNPRVAMLVTNKLASLFIEENLKVREQQAIGTSQFLADEIDRYREKVREKEALIYEFKRQHMNEMPEQLASNQSRLGQLQNQLQIYASQTNAAEDRRVQLQQQIADIERRAQEDLVGASGRTQSLAELLRSELSSDVGGGYVDESTLLALEAEAQKRAAQVDALLLSYTERHPDVVRAKAELARLEEKLAAERARVEAERARLEEENAASAEAEPAEEPAVAEQPEVHYPPVYAKLKVDLARVESEIERLVEQSRELQKTIEVYQQRIAATPARQLQLQQLSEDYGNLKAVLESLTDKKLQADLAENLERKQKGEQFQILDPANLPEKPFYPKRLRWVFAGFVGGFGLGCGVVILLDFLSLGVKTRQELLEALNLPVLGVMPEIVTPLGRRRRFVWRLGASVAGALCLLVTTFLVHTQVKPVPELLGELASQVQATHWTTVGAADYKRP